jgi:hypothetical protein
VASADAAAALARQGFRVFPCAENGKRPVWEGWPEWASADEATVRGWWGARHYNVGILTDDMVVVDIDTKPGKDGLASWMSLHGGFDTLTVRTPSGGYHLYYTGANVAINQGALGPGLDVRSYHGYVLGPGSQIDGKTYAVEMAAPMSPVPAEVLARCKPPGQKAANAQQSLVEADDPRAIALATQAVMSHPGATAGELSQEAFQLACKVRDYGVSEGTCQVVMAAWGARCQPPVIGEDLNGRIANAYLYAQNPMGSKHPDVMFGKIELPPLPETPVSVEPAAAVGFGNALILSALTPRPWVLRRFLLRRELTVLVAPGGVGKSLVMLLTGVFLATGQDMFGFGNALKRPAKSIIYNAEDSLEEMSMRLHALCTALNIDVNAVIPYLALLSGKTHGRQRLVSGQPAAINKEAFARFIDLAADPDVAMVGMDPLNKLHNVNGNDNIAMNFVMEQLEMLAEITDTAVMLAHHTSKPQMASSAGYAGSADSAQGAGAIKDSARIMMTLMAPSDDDARTYSLSGAERRMYLRLDDAKMNRTLANDQTTWLRKVPVRLWTGEEVGGLEHADMFKRTEATRQALGRAMDYILRNNANVGKMPMKEAVDRLRAYEAVFEKMKPADLRSLLQSLLAEPVITDTKQAVACWEQSGWWVGYTYE